jgi:DNA-binding MarR family transcriptional regulator
VYIHYMSDEFALKKLCNDVMHGCACQGVRRSARALTQHYDHALSAIGLKATQFPILVALELAGPVPLSPLADALVMDRTTLTRNLKALQERDLVTVEEGKDRRVRLLALTPRGRSVLEQALELWKVAQASVKTTFGADRLDSLLGELALLTGSVRN